MNTFSTLVYMDFCHHQGLHPITPLTVVLFLIEETTLIYGTIQIQFHKIIHNNYAIMVHSPNTRRGYS